MSIPPTGDRSGALAAFGIQAGPNSGEEVPIRLPVVSIGRGSKNDLVLADDSVSTTHARLEYENGAWRLTDLESANGTFVESVRLAPQVPTPLSYGSTVRFGGTRLHFRGVEAADPDAARASYTPPPAATTVRERRTGFRLPVWLVVLLLVLIALTFFLFGWVWTDPVVVPPAQTVLLTADWTGAPPLGP